MAALDKILVACEFDDSNSLVLNCGGALAGKHSAELHLLHVLPKQVPGNDLDDAIRHTREQLERLLPSEQVLELSVHWEVRTGSIAREIVGYAKEAGVNLIVMGSHHHTRLARIVGSNVTNQVLQTSPCAVTVVPIPRDSNLPTLSKTVQTLHNELGTSVPGEYEAVESQIREVLERRLNLTVDMTTAVMQQLQSDEALVWESDNASETAGADGSTRGVWHIRPDVVDHGDTRPVRATAVTTPAHDLLHRALSLRATDIHIDPMNVDEFAVRMRIDGGLEHYCNLDRDLAVHLQQQFKVFANLDIADPINPHEGRIQITDSGRDCQIRITTSPVEGGESVCLRLQSLDSIFRPLSDLGLTPRTLNDVEQILHRGEGIVLVTGPTGAGKTTTVYSMLHELQPHEHHCNIVTIEDPVEFNAPFLRQMSVREAHGFSLNKGLRTMLRMDPDVVFVGEIRDGETASMSMRAASSGKYVLSTLHTRDVASTVTALLDLNVPPRSLAGNLTGIISQRLIRRLCLHCREHRDITDAERDVFREHQIDPPQQLFAARGCDHCRNNGYYGRIGVFEVVVADDVIAEIINQGATEDETRQVIRSAGNPSLTTDGLSKAIKGLTSVEEVQRMRWL